MMVEVASSWLFLDFNLGAEIIAKKTPLLARYTTMSFLPISPATETNSKIAKMTLLKIN